MSHSLPSSNTLDVGVVGIEQDQLPPWQDGPLDLRSWFGEAGKNAQGQPRPIDLEIGSGKGTFLVQQATATPEVLYIGLEYAKAFWRHAADRCRRHGLSDRVRLVHIEAGLFVRNYVPDGCLRQVHIYFPDPWPKTKHHKRRLVQAPFLEQLHAKLQPDGLVRLATDHEGYFEWMQVEAAKVTHLFDRQDFERPASAEEGELVGTNFERKYRREGRPFNAMTLARR